MVIAMPETTEDLLRSELIRMRGRVLEVQDYLGSRGANQELGAEQLSRLRARRKECLELLRSRRRTCLEASS